MLPVTLLDLQFKASTVVADALNCVLQELKALVYPLTQVLLGAVRLVPTPRYFPLRLRCIRALLGLGKAMGQFIPLSPLLLEMLQVWDRMQDIMAQQPLLLYCTPVNFDTNLLHYLTLYTLWLPLWHVTMIGLCFTQNCCWAHAVVSQCSLLLCSGVSSVKGRRQGLGVCPIWPCSYVSVRTL